MFCSFLQTGGVQHQVSVVSVMHADIWDYACHVCVLRWCRRGAFLFIVPLRQECVFIWLPLISIKPSRFHWYVSVTEYSLKCPTGANWFVVFLSEGSFYPACFLSVIYVVWSSFFFVFFFFLNLCSGFVLVLFLTGLCGAVIGYVVNRGVIGLLGQLLKKSVRGQALSSRVWLSMMLGTSISKWFLALISLYNNNIQFNVWAWIHTLEIDSGYILVTTHFCSFWLNWAHDYR